MNRPPPPLQDGHKPQNRYFYTYRWSKKHDKAFIQALYYQARQGHKQLNRTPNQHSLMYARDVVNNGFGWSFHYNVIKARLNLLRKRYTTFYRILHTPGFRWDPIGNTVHASRQNWDRLCTEVEFANAYRCEGDPDWMELVAIFEPDEPEGEAPVPVTLSSDEEEDLNDLDLSSDEDGERADYVNLSSEGEGSTVSNA